MKIKQVPTEYIVINPKWEEIMANSLMEVSQQQAVLAQTKAWQTKDYSEANTEEGAPWIDSEKFVGGPTPLQKMALNFIYSELVTAGIIKEVKQ